MSAVLLIATAPERPDVPGFPPEIAEAIMELLQWGGSGKIQIDIVDGRVNACQTTKYTRARSRRLDETPRAVHDSGG